MGETFIPALNAVYQWQVWELLPAPAKVWRAPVNIRRSNHTHMLIQCDKNHRTHQYYHPAANTLSRPHEGPRGTKPTTWFGFDDIFVMMMLESVLAGRRCSKANATCVAHPSVVC